MLETDEIAGRLYRQLAEKGRHIAVEDVRIGASYVAVVLAGGRTGLAARLKEAVGAEIEPRRDGRRFTGGGSDRLLDFLVRRAGVVERALGLAAANALIHPTPPGVEADTIDLMGSRRRAGRHGGLFRPIVPRSRSLGAAHRHRARHAGERKEAGVGSCEGHRHGNDDPQRDPRGISTKAGPGTWLLIGPSTPLCEAIFRDTPVTHPAVPLLDTARILEVIAREADAPDEAALLRFVNIRVNRS